MDLKCLIIQALDENSFLMWKNELESICSLCTSSSFKSNEATVLSGSSTDSEELLAENIESKDDLSPKLTSQNIVDRKSNSLKATDLADVEFMKIVEHKKRLQNRRNMRKTVTVWNFDIDNDPFVNEINLEDSKKKQEI